VKWLLRRILEKDPTLEPLVTGSKYVFNDLFKRRKSRGGQRGRQEVRLRGMTTRHVESLG
jgi:hypothetical protein